VLLKNNFKWVFEKCKCLNVKIGWKEHAKIKCPVWSKINWQNVLCLLTRCRCHTSRALSQSEDSSLLHAKRSYWHKAFQIFSLPFPDSETVVHAPRQQQLCSSSLHPHEAEHGHLQLLTGPDLLSYSTKHFRMGSTSGYSQSSPLLLSGLFFCTLFRSWYGFWEHARLRSSLKIWAPSLWRSTLVNVGNKCLCTWLQTEHFDTISMVTHISMPTGHSHTQSICFIFISMSGALLLLLQYCNLQMMIN